MSSNGLRDHVERLLLAADIRIDGERPWDLQVHNEDFHARVLAHGSLGLGESYMEGWWDTADLEGLIARLIEARLDQRILTRDAIAGYLKARLLNLQKPSRAFQIGQVHYDIGNDLYRQMLGQRLVYSCGYWAHATDLDAAQEAKLDLICRKLGLAPGMRVLDIGCGWGEALKFAAERYGVSGVGITVSEQQAEYARNLCAEWPIEIRLQDYRELDDTFDRIFSIGMFEHVGVKNYRTYMEVTQRCLKGDGLSLLHCIGGLHSVNTTDPWIAKYIFPNSMVPSARQICEAVEGLFVLEDWHNFGADYEPTLLAWRRNFEANWDAIKGTRDETFYRMWRFYLSGSAASFRTRRNQLWQIVLSPHGVPGGYRAPR